MNQLELLDQLIGKDNSVIVSRLLVRIFGGLQEGAFIQQLYYWSSRTSDPEGWIHKTYDDWFNECFATKYTITKICKEYDFIKTDRRKSPFYQWQPVNVYYLDRDAFLKFLKKHEVVDFGTENISRSEDEISDVPIEQQNFDVPINNEYTKTTNKGAYSKLIVDEYVRRGMPLDAMVRMVVDETVRDISSALDRKGLPNPYYMTVDDVQAMIAWLQESAQSWVDFSASAFTSKAIRAKFATRKIETPEAERRYKKLG